MNEETPEKSKRRVAVLVAILSSILIGCNASSIDSTSASGEHPAPPVTGAGKLSPSPNVDSSVEPAATQKNEDAAIIDLALADLIEYNGDDLPLSLAPKIPRKIFFSTQPLDKPPRAAVPLEENSMLDATPNAEKKAIREAIFDVKQRYQSGERVTRFTSTRDMVQVVDSALTIDDKADDPPYSALYPVQAYVPGYSTNGRFAVVHLFFPEQFHPSFITYVLIKKKGKWAIEFRGIITFV